MNFMKYLYPGDDYSKPFINSVLLFFAMHFFLCLTSYTILDRKIEESLVRASVVFKNLFFSSGGEEVSIPVAVGILPDKTI